MSGSLRLAWMAAFAAMTERWCFMEVIEGTKLSVMPAFVIPVEASGASENRNPAKGSSKTQELLR
jgi:hypothetical protein